jgi:uncharacterized metal-binding protein
VAPAVPGNKVHDAIGSMAAPVVALAALQISHGNVATAIAAGIGELAGTIWLSPDLDLTSATIDERWGGWFGRAVWMPYDKLIPHRSIISHGFGVGILLRLLYICAFVFAIAKVLELVGVVMVMNILKGVAQWMVTNPHISVSLLAGLVLSETIHTVTDYASTGFKRSKFNRHHH